MNMAIWILAAALSLAALAQAGGTRREVVRDSSGRTLYTIEHREGSGDLSRATIRDASGRLMGTAVTRKNSSGRARTEYRDASGRLTGTSAGDGGELGFVGGAGHGD